MKCMISLIGILVGLALLVLFAFKGKSLLWAAPLCAMLVALTAGLDLLPAYIDTYMTGFVGFTKNWFPAFMLSALLCQLMQDSGAAQSLTKSLVNLMGKKHVIFVCCLAGGILAYGGISGFVIIFSMYPIVLGLFRAANITRRLIPATIMVGAFQFAMSAPGSPTIQNLIPGEHFGTPPMSAPFMGAICAVFMFVAAVLWLTYRAKKFQAAGEGFTEPENAPKELPEDKLPNPLTILIPFVAILILLNVLRWHIVTCLVIAIVLTIILLVINGLVKKEKYLQNIGESFNKGSMSAVSAVMNTSAAVGFGSVVGVTVGFKVLEGWVLGIGGSPLISLSIAVNILAAATGSASGGMQIALNAMAEKFITMSQTSGVPLEAFHRVSAIGCGGLNTMPHDGAVVTYLDYCKVTHQKGYFDMFISAGLIPVLANILAIILASVGIV